MHRDGSGQQCGEWHDVGKHSYGNREHDFWRDMRKARLVIHFGRHGGLKRLLCRLVERGNVMAITDELRHNIEGAEQLYGRECPRLRAIADRIDAEHEREISRATQLLADAEKDRDFNYANWQDCKQKVLQHNITIDELSAEIERLKEELAHRIEPPKDEDGEPIHIGNVMESGDGNVFVVSSVDYGRHSTRGDGEFWMLWSEDADFYERADECRHHKQPTVEDVLHEFICDHEEGVRDEVDLIAEYAKRLLLASDESKEVYEC